MLFSSLRSLKFRLKADYIGHVTADLRTIYTSNCGHVTKDELGRCRRYRKRISAFWPTHRTIWQIGSKSRQYCRGIQWTRTDLTRQCVSAALTIYERKCSKNLFYCLNASEVFHMDTDSALVASEEGKLYISGDERKGSGWKLVFGRKDIPLNSSRF